MLKLRTSLLVFKHCRLVNCHGRETTILGQISSIDQIELVVELTVFENFEWMMQWGHVQTEYDMSQMSCHSPMLLSISTVTRPGKIPFKFLNVWVDYATFLKLVQEV